MEKRGELGSACWSRRVTCKRNGLAAKFSYKRIEGRKGDIGPLTYLHVIARLQQLASCTQSLSVRRKPLHSDFRNLPGPGAFESCCFSSDSSCFDASGISSVSAVEDPLMDIALPSLVGSLSSVASPPILFNNDCTPGSKPNREVEVVSLIPEMRDSLNSPGFSVVSTMCCDGAVSSILGSGLDMMKKEVFRALIA